jgi:hypothetical protein
MSKKISRGYRGKIFFISAARAVGVALAIAAVAGCAPNGSQVPTDVVNVPTCSVPPATVATWFKSGSISKDGEVTPADSVNFTNHPNCDFYVWSERMFLWLTSPAPANYGGGGGRIFASPAFFDVSPAANDLRTLIPHRGTPLRFQVRTSQVGAHALPMIHDRIGRLFEVAPTPLSARQLPEIRDARGELVEIQRSALNDKGEPQFFDTQNRLIDFHRTPPEPSRPDNIAVVQKFTVANKTFFIDAFGNVLEGEQAEADDGVLVAQNNSLVYYTIEVNDVYGYFVSGVNATPASITATFFPTSAAEVTPIQAYATTKGAGTFPDPEALAVELKTSWVEATGLPANCNYITMQAEVPVYNMSDPAHWKEMGTATKNLAMVGMHVVGSTNGHHEMIWATFEHICNAPNSGYTYNGSTSGKAGPTETGPWLFSSTNTPSAMPNVPRQFFNSTVTPMQIDANMSQTTYPHTVGPADIVRTFPWGMPGSNAISNTEVIAVDHSALPQLASGDLRANYILTGATWTIGGVINGTQVGTNQLANTTMETYQQGTNCFACHNNPTPADPKGNLGLPQGRGLSHIFGEIQSLP